MGNVENREQSIGYRVGEIRVGEIRVEGVRWVPKSSPTPVGI
jgi:hypothetical protein